MQNTLEIPTLGEKTIRAFVGDPSFARGEVYFRAGAVFDARREGRTLRARCEGSELEAYRVSVAFDARGVASATCACPVGDEGRCKHVGAALLAWVHAPAEFVAVEPLAAVLARRSRDELVALVTDLARAGDVAGALEALVTPAAPPPREPADESATRCAVAAVFRVHGRATGAAEAIAAALRAMLAGAGARLARGDHDAAVTTVDVVLRAVLLRERRVRDEAGVLRAVADECLAALGRALAVLAADAPTRARVLDALWDAWRRACDAGVRDAGRREAAVVARHGTRDDRDVLVRRAGALAARSEGWARRQCEAFRADLARDTLDDAAYLALCREAGRIDDLVLRLLERGDHAGARVESARLGDAALLALFERAAGGACEPGAIELVRERATATPGHVPLLEFLRDRCAARGDVAGVIEWAEWLLASRLDLADYRALRAVAVADRAGVWPTVRAGLLPRLEAHTALLAEIHLLEGDLADAIAAARAAETTRGPRGLEARLAVARAVERAHPRNAVALYERAVEQYIAARGRAHYREARACVDRMRALYARLGDVAEGERRIDALRARFRELPALQEEMTATATAR